MYKIRARLKQTASKFINSTLAVVMLASGMGGALPLLITAPAHAIPNTSYGSTPFSSLGLATDRATPSGGYTIGSNTLELKVDNTNANTSGHYYQTEGLGASFSRVNTVSANLTVPSDWQSKPVDAGLWAVTTPSTNGNQDIGYPIIAFIGNATDPYLPHGATGFSIYNTFTGVWSNPTGFDTTNGWDKSYKLDVSYNPATSNFDFYVNDSLLGSYSASDGTDTYTGLGGVIFDSFNTATNDAADDYTVDWADFKTGLYVPTAPTNLHMLDNTHNNYAPLAAGYVNTTTVNPTQLDLVWDTVPGTDHYITTAYLNGVKVGNPGWTGTPNAWVGNGVGFDQYGDGAYTFQVCAYGTGGTAGPCTTSGAYIVDTTKPDVSITSPAQNATVNDNASISISASDNIALTKISYEIDNTSGVALPGKYAVKNTTATSDTLSKTVGSFNLDDGTYQIKATATDGAGNYKVVQAYKFTVDNTAPATPTLTYPSNNAYLNVNDFWFDWNDVSGADSYEIQASQSPSVDSNGSLNNGVWSGDASHAQPTDSTAHSVGANGTWYWQVRAKDAAGNYSGWSQVSKLTIDLVKPQVTDFQQVYNAAKPRIDVTLTFSEALNPSSLGQGWYAVSGSNNTQFTKAYYNSKLQTVNFADLAGNTNTYSFTTDFTAPTGTFTYSNNNGNTLTKDDVTATLTTSEAVQDIAGWTRVSPTEFTKAFEHNGTFTVALVDLVGNPSTVSGQVKRIDRAAPTISGVSDGALVKGPVNLSIFDPAYEGYFGFDALHGLKINGAETATTETSGHQFVVDVQNDGTYTVVATDKASNQSSPVTFTIDNTAPVVALDTTVPSELDGTKDVTITGTATDNVSGMDRVALQINDLTDTTQSFNFKSHTFTGANGAWSITIPANTLADGHEYKLSFTGYDKLNNHSAPQHYTTTINDPSVIDVNGGSGNGGNDTTTLTPLTTPTHFVALQSVASNNVQGGNNTDNTDSAVLGASTDNPNDSKGEVKGDSTEKNDPTVTVKNTASDSKPFLGLGWWWLAILAALLLLIAAIIGKRRQTGNEA